jgi:membrane associated rhomboid family serine protease
MVTYALIIANFAIFIITVFNYSVVYELGFKPSFLSLGSLPQLYTLFTSMFIHGDFFHLLGNMLIFLFIGIAFEQRIGWKNFIIIYLVTGVCGAITHAFLDLSSQIPLIGASGAIFGIMGAFAYSYPKDEVVMPIPLGIIMIFRRIKVIYAVVLFAALETVIVLIGSQDNTAHFAHIGGLVSGIVIAIFLIGKQGEKTGIKSPTEIYYDPSIIPKKKKIDFSSLKKLATTPELKDILHRIEQESLMQVRDIWLEQLLEKATCPKCGKPLSHVNRKIWCEENHFKTEY